jgi:hypothetical protein
MRSVQHCQTRWQSQVHGVATMPSAQRANHRVIIDGPKTHHLIAIPVRDEDFASRRNNGDTPGIQQRAGGSRQLSHPGAIRGPQHCHSIVAVIHHEEEGLVGGQRQAARVVGLTVLIALRSDSALPLALQLT